MFSSSNIRLLIIVFSLWLASCMLSKNYNRGWEHIIISTDMEGYYMYLPATLIYNGFEKIPVKTREQFLKYPGTNKTFTKYTYGVALMQLPFFCIAHIYSLLFNPAEADGYTYPYIFSVIAAASFYMALGVCIIFVVLSNYFSRIISALTLLLLYTGSNLYYYTICQPGMSHIYSFCLFAMVVYLTPKILAGGRLKYWLAYGFLFGLIVLTRPTGCIIILYPLLYGIHSFTDIGTRVRYLFSKAGYVIIAGVVAFVVFVPQFIYWKYISGNFIIYSYGQEGFTYWQHPKIFRVLFDVWNGWLLYSPLMVLSLIGLVISLRKRTEQGIAITVIFFLAIYIFASWWAWWFGGAFGYRPVVEYYSLLAFPMAMCLAQSRKNRVLMSIAIVFVIVAVYYNLKLTYLYKAPWDGENWNWNSFEAVLKRLV